MKIRDNNIFDSSFNERFDSAKRFFRQKQYWGNRLCYWFANIWLTKMLLKEGNTRQVTVNLFESPRPSTILLRDGWLVQNYESNPPRNVLIVCHFLPFFTCRRIDNVDACTYVFRSNPLTPIIFNTEKFPSDEIYLFVV